jgi:hypothetical protein
VDKNIIDKIMRRHAKAKEGRGFPVDRIFASNDETMEFLDVIVDVLLAAAVLLEQVEKLQAQQRAMSV